MVMMNHSPISGVLLESAEIPLAAEPFGVLVNGSGVDMRNFDGVAALVQVTVVAGAGTWQVFLQMADDAGFTQNVTPIVDAGTGAAASSPAGGTTTGFFWVEAYRPPKRFVRAVSNPLVANITLAVTMFRYKHTGNNPIHAKDALGLSNRVVVRAA